VAERKALQQAATARRAQATRNAAAVLGAFVDGPYTEWAEVHLRSHKDTLRALRADFAPWWGRAMDSLTETDIERWRRGALAAGNQKSTVNRAWQRLRAVLGKAHERGLIGPPPKVRRFKLDRRGRVRYLTPDERARLLTALDEREQRRREERARMIDWQRARGLDELAPHGTYTDHLKPLTLLVLNSGLRRGEALGLTWGAIDLVREQIHVEAATSKSGQSRDIPMTAEARKVLGAWRNQRAPTDPRTYLFTLPDGKRLQSIGHKTWGEVMAAARIKDFRFHDLRHDYASRLVMADVDLYSVSKLLGHSDVSMTQRYAHLAPDYLKSAVRKLDSAERAA
jgi:integrase